MADKLESPQTTNIPYWRLVFERGVVTQEIVDYQYPGSGTEQDPYVVSWIPDDPRNPMRFSQWTKWTITMSVAIATLAVSLDSSAFTGGAAQIQEEFQISTEVVTLGVSLFVLGFAIGPLLWAPLSELFGRQPLFIGTYCALTAFNCGAAGAQNSWTLMIMRFFAGAFGSSPLTNAGGSIADMFPANERALAMSMFAAAPFLGPVLGPIIGGFLGMKAGWRWVMGLTGAFSGVVLIMGTLLIPETYAPVLLRHRAAKLSAMTGNIYISKADIEQGKPDLRKSFKVALSRPWALLFREPIVFLLSLYLAIIYGTLFMLFAAYPIIFQQVRGWNQGVGGLPFLGIMVGMLLAVGYTILDNNMRYIKTVKRHGGTASPEARLPPCILASITIPMGLFWFAWTNSPSIHFMACISAGVPFGFGMVLIILGVMNYLIDAYTIYAASVLAANSVMRSCFGAAFPMFTKYMYQSLGIHWASSIPAFLALACAPFPFLFYKYGTAIRTRCKYAAESEAFMRKLQEQAQPQSSVEPKESGRTDSIASEPSDMAGESDKPATA
ncbi:hypothetical protein BDW74DRAFT_181475 [Aspergillus multicolor]|uniref:MFS transporter n=1 Tax=Aspergillus multicolor TaxID=41759 RepID=UPI003CCE25DF